MFLLNTYEVEFVLLVLRTVSAFIHAIVRITPGHEKTGVCDRPVSPYRAIYAAYGLAQPPDQNGHTPRKLPARAAISRIIADCALTGALLSYNNIPVCVKDFFKKFSPFLPKFLPPFLYTLSCGFLSPLPTTGGGAVRPAQKFSPD